ncbi:hypothetical protein ACFORH_29200 [Amycolatopsis roodepoortensis]|uniref:Uncharacterized protein n=1 Tax=Amycolatopsis roodepoortensis TaxID=700274 RepID=A0ABR9LJC5_9PSEU|nr:hypothetical protein [Amycolatopsis roodepoortensis]MBE1580303.1 hypothetical protein [Amycolatopsis roodepoortensis]
MRSIEFRRISTKPAERETSLQFLIDGVSFLELVREAELPGALAEPAPLLAGDYAPSTRLSVEHLLGGAPDRVPHGVEDDEHLLLGCTCGIDDCWALVAKIATSEDTVTWSGLRNTYRDWDYGRIGDLTFSRRQYEKALDTAFGVA